MSFECHTCRLHLKLQLFLCHRMLKSQFCRTESQRFLTILTGIILSVTNQRHSGMRHLHTNLMMPACIQINPNQISFATILCIFLIFPGFQNFIRQTMACTAILPSWTVACCMALVQPYWTVLRSSELSKTSQRRPS